MDYKERMAQFCDKQCSDRNECEYKACNKTFRCDYLSGIMYGWELGQQDTLEEIEKALTPQRCLTDLGIDVCAEALVKTALQTIEALKKK